MEEVPEDPHGRFFILLFFNYVFEKNRIKNPAFVEMCSLDPENRKVRNKDAIAICPLFLLCFLDLKNTNLNKGFNIRPAPKSPFSII